MFLLLTWRNRKLTWQGELSRAAQRLKQVSGGGGFHHLAVPEQKMHGSGPEGQMDTHGKIFLEARIFGRTKQTLQLRISTESLPYCVSDRVELLRGRSSA